MKFTTQIEEISKCLTKAPLLATKGPYRKEGHTQNKLVFWDISKDLHVVFDVRGYVHLYKGATPIHTGDPDICYGLLPMFSKALTRRAIRRVMKDMAAAYDRCSGTIPGLENVPIVGENLAF